MIYEHEGKKYIRMGECNNCGACEFVGYIKPCPHLILNSDSTTRCKIHNQLSDIDDTLALEVSNIHTSACSKYPNGLGDLGSPEIRNKCGYYFMEVEKNNMGRNGLAKKTTPLTQKERTKKYREKYPDRVRKMRRDWAKKNPDKQSRLSRNWHIKNHYGITEEQYNNLFKQQNGLCAICDRPETRIFKGKLSKLNVDHNHTTNKIRGLICMSCNIALGKVDDNILILEAMIGYLEATKNG